MESIRCFYVPILVLACLVSHNSSTTASEIRKPGVTLMRTPEGGIQPQVVVDSGGRVHLLYFKGDPAAGDLFYVRREAGESRFSAPLRVNSHPGSAVAMGTIRGGQIAVGKEGRVHVVWNGSKNAQPRVADAEHDTPMLYTHLNDSGTAFGPQRNLIQYAFGLDGGGSVAADGHGNVYVAWHANPAANGEANRRVYLATSRDGGKSFAAEVAISAPATGSCGCCGLKAFVDSKDRVLVLYRSAKEQFYRDMYLLASSDRGQTFHSRVVDPWQVGQCPMSSAAFAEGPDEVFAGWETAGEVFMGRVAPQAGEVAEPISASGSGEARKHPALAVNSQGQILFAWTEGTGWNRGGRLAWQVYDPQGKPTALRGSRDGVPVWSLVSAFANEDGSFTIVY